MKKSIQERIAAKVTILEGDCHQWNGTRLPNGYPIIGWHSTTVHPVRALKNLPHGWRLFQTCQHLDCVNPDHYEAYDASPEVRIHQQIQKRKDGHWIWMGAMSESKTKPKWASLADRPEAVSVAPSPRFYHPQHGPIHPVRFLLKAGYDRRIKRNPSCTHQWCVNPEHWGTLPRRDRTWRRSKLLTYRKPISDPTA